jgi:hypothetical protein
MENAAKAVPARGEALAAAPKKEEEEEEEAKSSFVEDD